MPKVISLLTVVFILFSACAGTGASSKKDSERDAKASADAANAALAAMDSGGTTAPAAADSGANTPGQASGQNGNVPDNRPKPAWVDTPDAVYTKQLYISAVGYGSDRNQAERDALGKLTGVFGQSVQAELKTISNYSEAVKSGAIQVSGNNSVQNAITTSAEMDTLVGAEIADVWYDNKSVYYAAAVMEKEKTSALYADLIQSNKRIIDDLVNIDDVDRNTLDAYSRYLLAGTIADANRVYANVLTIVGNTRGINPAEMKKGDDYRLQAAAVAKNIPIGVTVSGDRNDRIRNAFSKALGAAGFRSGGNNSRYMLNVVYTMSQVELPAQQNKFIRYQANAGLEDTSGGNSVLVSYDVSGREGHLTVPEAEERALRAAEKKIADEFVTALNDYLSTLIPKH